MKKRDFEIYQQKNRYHYLRKLLFIGFLTLIVFTSLFALSLFYQHISQEPITYHLVLENAPCGIVLTGGRGRIQMALEMFRKRRIEKLLISGVHPSVTFEDLVTAWDEFFRLDIENIFLDYDSTTTGQNALFGVQWLKEKQCTSFYLMTSAIHMPRARLLFNKALKGSSIPLISVSFPPSSWESGFLGRLEESFKWLLTGAWL